MAEDRLRTPPPSPSDADFGVLIARYQDGRVTEQELRRLNEYLVGDAACRRFFVRTCLFAGVIAESLVPDLAAAAPPANDDRPTVRPAPILGFLGSAGHGTVGRLASGWPAAYLVATVILGLGILVGSLIPASPSARIAVQSVPLPSPLASLPTAVGRITDMVDCRWTEGPEVRGQRSGVRTRDSSLSSLLSPLVRLGDRFALSSGLMEITYNTGAKVILQGPATYTVESAAGGFLAIGKLTARLEKAEGGRGKAEGVASGQWLVASGNQQSTINNPQSSNPKSQISNPKSQISNLKSQISNLSPAFVVRTPTALITDLGTEFGVEVNRRGLTTSHVFRGTVRLQSVGADGAGRDGVLVLHENESAGIEEGVGDTRIVIRRVSIDPRMFRRVIRPIQTLDLLDIVAGGSGLGHRRERGIDPVTAMEDPVFFADLRPTDHRYHPATTYRQKLIDGVFIPEGSQGAVQLDSAGHTFSGFPKTDGDAWGPIWARAVAVKPMVRTTDPRRWIYCIGPCEPLMPDKRGLLGIHANAGITFSLEAMRHIHAGVRPARFRAVVGVANPHGVADFWIFVNGRPQFRQTQLRQTTGVVPIDVALGVHDRFLTLATTDAGTGCDRNWLVVGDPILEMVSTDEERP
jgi:hypothetical protein